MRRAQDRLPPSDADVLAALAEHGPLTVTEVAVICFGNPTVPEDTRVRNRLGALQGERKVMELPGTWPCRWALYEISDQARRGIASGDLRPGVRLRYGRSDRVVTLSHRKDDDSGWWNTDGSGFSDDVLADDHCTWRVDSGDIHR